VCKLLNRYDVKMNNNLGSDDARNGEKNEKRAAVSGRVMSANPCTPRGRSSAAYTPQSIVASLKVKGIAIYANDRLEAIDFHP
jgi:hypothetical protein